MPVRKKVQLKSRSAAELVKSACSESSAALLKHHTRAMLFQAEPIHQMRVGTRRLRAILRVFGDILDAPWALELESELRWIAQLLGTVRDIDVLRSRLRASVKQQDSEERAAFRIAEKMLGKRYRDAKSAMLEGLNSERYTALLERLREGQLAPQVTIEANAPAIEVLLPLLNRAWKKLSRAADQLKRSDEAPAYHRVRKMGKRIRYALELLCNDFSEKDRQHVLRFIDRMKKLQDTLGELQDAEVASRTISIIAHQANNHYEGFRELVNVQQRLEVKARRKFPKSWKAARKEGSKKWMSGLSGKSNRATK